jgi:hypothetical protein
VVFLQVFFEILRSREYFIAPVAVPRPPMKLGLMLEPFMLTVKEMIGFCAPLECANVRSEVLEYMFSSAESAIVSKNLRRPATSGELNQSKISRKHSHNKWTRTYFQDL